MKTLIIVLALTLAACGKPSDGQSPVAALSCSPMGTFQVLYPDGVTRASDVEQCSDGCNHNTPFDGSGIKLSVCIQLETIPIH